MNLFGLGAKRSVQQQNDAPDIHGPNSDSDNDEQPPQQQDQPSPNNSVHAAASSELAVSSSSGQIEVVSVMLEPPIGTVVQQVLRKEDVPPLLQLCLFNTSQIESFAMSVTQIGVCVCVCVCVESGCPSSQVSRHSSVNLQWL